MIPRITIALLLVGMLPGPGHAAQEKTANATPLTVHHSADTAGDGRISLSELLRVIQLFNAEGYHCAGAQTSEDGYLIGTEGPTDCTPHDSDYDPANWRIGLGELLRLAQLFNAGGYYGPAHSEDGFLPRGTLPDSYLVPLPDDTNGNHLTEAEEAALEALGLDPGDLDGVALALELLARIEALPGGGPCDSGAPHAGEGLGRCSVEAEHMEYDGVTDAFWSATGVALVTAEGQEVYRIGILGRLALAEGSFSYWDCGDGPAPPETFSGVCTSMRLDVPLLYSLLEAGPSS